MQCSLALLLLSHFVSASRQSGSCHVKGARHWISLPLPVATFVIFCCSAPKSIVETRIHVILVEVIRSSTSAKRWYITLSFHQSSFAPTFSRNLKWVVPARGLSSNDNDHPLCALHFKRKTILFKTSSFCSRPFLEDSVGPTPALKSIQE